MNNKGFTLIELLISVTLLSLIMFAGNYVYSQLSSRWNKELGDFEHNLSVLKGLNYLNQSLQGIEPYVVKTSKNIPVFFFIGADKSLLGVTKRGVFTDSRPEIFRISAVKNIDGKFSLVYQATSSASIILSKSDQEIEFHNQMVLLDDLDDVTFSYYGWPSLEVKTNPNQEEKEKWFPEYSGINNLLVPEKVSLTLVKNNQNLLIQAQLDLESNRWLQHHIKIGF